MMFAIQIKECVPNVSVSTLPTAEGATVGLVTFSHLPLSAPADAVMNTVLDNK